MLCLLPDVCYVQDKLYMQASGEPIPLTTERIQQFGKDIIAAVQQQMSRGETVRPSVYFLPGTVMLPLSCQCQNAQLDDIKTGGVTAQVNWSFLTDAQVL